MSISGQLGPKNNDRKIALATAGVAIFFSLSCALPTAFAQTNGPTDPVSSSTSSSTDSYGQGPNQVYSTPASSQTFQPSAAAPNGTNSVPMSSALAAHKNYLLAWKMGLDGEDYSNQIEKAQVMGFGLTAQYKQLLFPDLMLKVKASASLQSGYAQSQFGDNTPKSGILLSEAVLQYKPFSFFQTQVGAVDQSFLNAPDLVSASAFPGVQEKIMVGSDKLGFDITAEQAIPTSTTLSTQTSEDEQTPYFLNETLTLKGQPFEDLGLKVFGTHYSFTTLPNVVALASQSYGNSVIQEGATSSQFTYAFDGWMVGSEAKLKLTRTLSWTVGGHIIENSSAPISYRDGQYIQTGLDVGLPHDIDFKPMAATFFTENDVAPGFYNSSEMGHNNRQGWEAGADFVFKKEKFKIGASYISADLINPNTYQSNQQYIQLRFESLYEIL